MRRLTVSLGGGYDVIISRGILKSCGDEIRKVTAAKMLLIVCGETVAKLYADALKAQLEKCGYKVAIFIYKGGEAAKSLPTLTGLLEYMAELKMCRSDCVLALGGGVTGDIAGFAAATYMRGINLIQIPTTLLSMVDSSVGGKCAVNLDCGKNLVGTFYQPRLVLCDPDTLATLPQDILCDGYSEIAKYSMLCKPCLLSISDGPIEDIIYESLDAKRSYIEEDERDKGKRAYLNLGHTVAHAIEKSSNFSISHGKAVAMGLALMSHYDDDICGYLRAHGLPVELSFELNELCKLMINDKKCSGDSICLVEYEKLGSCTLRHHAFDELYDILSGWMK